MHKTLIKTAALLAAMAVLLGAFGAHKLKEFASVATLATYETAVRYQFYHVFALLLTGILYKEYPFKQVITAGKLFIIGTVIFSGSLYLLTYISIAGIDRLKWIGAITPIGGVILIIGWVLLAIGIKKQVL
jgi:uncharacterized membrane protein YgdD (TMEM256/DUF423 family)